MADVVLDYNQIIEETPVTGDSVPDSGGLITFQFKCDVNGATDLSNSFFAADLDVQSVNASGTAQGRYIPDAYDFHAFPMLRCFQSVTHIIDGQTVCNSQHPYADALIVEKFLTTHSKSNIENFQALSLCKQIDNGMKEYNIFSFDKPACMYPDQQKGGYQAYLYDWAKPGLFRSKYTSNTTASYLAAGSTLSSSQHASENVSDRVVTMLFQPPFDLWRLRQPFHGGIHQIQFNLKSSDSTLGWGGYMTTSCVGMTYKGPLIYDLPRGLNGTIGTTANAVNSHCFGRLSGMPIDNTGAFDVADMSAFCYTSEIGPNRVRDQDPDSIIATYIAAAQLVDRVNVDIKRLRLLRRVVRTAVPPQLSNVQYNFTELSMQHGTPTDNSMSQQFLLPSTTFGLIFYWRESTNSDYDQVGVHPNIERITSTIDSANSAVIAAGLPMLASDFDVRGSLGATLVGTASSNTVVITFEDTAANLNIQAGDAIMLTEITTPGSELTRGVKVITAVSGSTATFSETLTSDVSSTACSVELLENRPVGFKRVGNALSSNSMYRVNNLDFDLHDFQFTYGGATYPMQRIQRITGNKSHTDSSNPYGWQRMMTLQNQLQGVYNSTMDDFPNSYGHGYGKGVLNRMDPHMMFFPVSRTGNSDNGILQVEYTCGTRRPASNSLSSAATTGKDVQLVVVALYDAQLNMQYSSNELQQIVLTQFK